MLVLLWVALIVPSLVFAVVGGAVSMPRMVATAWDSLGVQWHALTGGVGGGDYGRAGVAVLKMVSLVLPVAGLLALLGRTGLRTTRKTWAWTGGSTWRRGSPCSWLPRWGSRSAGAGGRATSTCRSRGTSGGRCWSSRESSIRRRPRPPAGFW